MVDALEICELAMIGDRRTAALIGRDGAVLWHCPERFDQPSLFGALLDPRAGDWRLELARVRPAGRRHLGDSGALETRLRSPAGDWTATDWLNMGEGAPAGVFCRRFSAPPASAQIVLSPRPDYGAGQPQLEVQGKRATVNGRWSVHASHPLASERGGLRMELSKGEPGWMILGEGPLDAPSGGDLDRWLKTTLAAWAKIADRATYHGLYETEVAQSIRALRLLTHEGSGGVIAAATTSLPEIAGGERNYDYRYVWLRDAAMIVSALTRAGSDGTDERRFLGFLCSTRRPNEEPPLPPFAALDGELVPEERRLDHLRGWRDSRPVLVGNGARTQLQLDGLGNVLLAAKLIYGRPGAEREHWHVVREVADHLAEHWREPDHGLWEESAPRQYTSSKVIAVCGLDSIADFADQPAQAERWRCAAHEIRGWIGENGLTSEGAYASVAGGEQVDVSAALFPVWNYCAPDSPEMLATMAALERDHSPDGLLYRRTLEDADARAEGAFLAGTFWVAQYWIMRGALDRARRILDAGLAYANDVGLFAEEAEPDTGRMLGNIPQSFVHAAFIGAAIDLKAAMEASGAGAGAATRKSNEEEI